jgi:acyl-CoA synthetase (AMP-forming)/AMP-acid ligase II
MLNNIILTVGPNLTIHDYSGDYTRQDLARAVSYWRKQIDLITDPRPIAICFGAGSTTFQTVAVLLAIIDSGRNYYKFDQLSPGATKETIKYPKIEGGVSVTFIAGNISTDFDYSNDPDVIEVGSNYHREHSIQYTSLHSLDIEFRISQKRYNNTSGTSSGFPTLIEASVGNDGYSIKTAMDNYIQEDDCCVFLHGMSHIGVHTTAILPSIFKAEKVTFVSSGKEWQEKIVDATHTQFFYTMLDWNKLPKQNKLRTITTGGDYLKPRMIEDLILNTAAEKIVDIYGLTEAAPPLAIREIKSIDDLSKPFNWVNNYYDCYISNDSVAMVVRPDEVHWRSNDIARFNDESKEFFYLGRFGAGLKVRMKGLLFDTFEFKEKFEQETGIVNYFLDTSHDDIPILIVTEKDYAIAQNFTKTFDATVSLNVVDTLSTNGGIKNIS